ncbi:nucleotidyltransferase [Sedimentibacter sp.]|uniref:nucleotidyltransferase domain-containing protein n=1 Tax=Sedimentibacter sp. TaxID=1960295 RepID=UPI00289C6FDE|nr:nucleotidyltransferase [Sedimentibacter sp.]
MITDSEKMLDRIYNEVANSLNISSTMFDKAVKSYEAVGSWLGDAEYIGDIKVFPQGSFGLGTVVRPLTDEDDGYDIDLVSLMEDGFQLDDKMIKSLVGKRLKENATYKNKLEPEGKRCWTLNYDGFHMDILPCVPRHSIYLQPNFTEIRLTHKTGFETYEPRFSNPQKYIEWFEQQMSITLNEEKKAYSYRNKVDIETVKTYKVRTPLQKAIQLLKRHRDIMFEGEENAPISIIITTLAARSYNNEVNLFDAVKNILLKMPLFINKNVDGKFEILNPVVPDENFADKWNLEPKKCDAFFKWLRMAQLDIIENPLSVTGLNNVSSKLEIAFGKKITEKSLTEMAINDRKLREKGNLYINGLMGGITSEAAITTKKIGGHTFFGK